MSLRHAILTALMERPSSGLDLARRFDRSIRYFWSASHQQVYRELARLEEDGLIESVPQPSSPGKRKMYKVLPLGREELVAWVARYEGPRPDRDPLIVRLRAATVVGVGPLVEHMKSHLAAHEARRDEYQEIAQRDFAGQERDEVAHLQHLILRAGIGLEEFWMSWLESAIQEISDVRAGGSFGHGIGKIAFRSENLRRELRPPS